VSCAASDAPRCAACGSHDIHDLGALPDYPRRLFCGQSIHLDIVPGHLMRCEACALQFRHPALSEEELTALYESLPDSVWEGGIEERPYWPALKRQLDLHSRGKKVMDVGCFTGGFLRWLPPDWDKHGIEPGRQAAAQAERGGVKVLGRTAADLESASVKFDVILACDVIEHLTQPVRFMQRLSQALAPDGCLIILTGATDSWPYRLLGRHFWYGSFPEHVTFYCRRWFEWVAPEAGLSLVHHEFLTTERRRWLPWLAQMARQILHASTRKAIEAGISPDRISRIPWIGRAAKWKSTPWWKQSTDHGLIVLRKTPPQS
jgi:SAM-dependent methyltransferase